ncbi:MAG: TadE/TadG family type IV pilus assembly protein [Sphingomonas sp.]
MALFSRCRGNRRGTSTIEFALVLPLFGYLLYGILGYGQYFLLAHNVQQIANDAARATVAGLSADERRTLATSAIDHELGSLRTLSAGDVSSSVDETSDTVTVRVRLDASNVPLIRNSFIPMPDAVIERRAVVRPGGIA